MTLTSRSRVTKWVCIGSVSLLAAAGGVVAACGTKAAVTAPATVRGAAMSFTKLSDLAGVAGPVRVGFREVSEATRFVRVYAKEGSGVEVASDGKKRPLVESESPTVKIFGATQGDVLATSADEGWHLSSKRVVRSKSVSGNLVAFGADLSSPCAPVGAVGDVLFCLEAGALKRFRLADNVLSRSSLKWPDASHSPLSVSSSADGKTLVFASAKFMFTYSVAGAVFGPGVPLSLTGVEGDVKSVALFPRKEGEASRWHAAVLTSKGLFATDKALSGSLSAAPSAPPSSPAGPKAPVVSFASHIAPISERACASCHGPTSPYAWKDSQKEGAWTAAAAKILERLQKPAGDAQRMPMGISEAAFSSADRAVLVAWLQGVLKATKDTEPAVVVTPGDMNPGEDDVPDVVMATTVEVLANAFTNLQGYALESPIAANGNRQVVKIPGDASATFSVTFSGTAGTYRVDVEAVDEDDGAATLSAQKGSTTIGSTVLDQSVLNGATDTNNVVRVKPLKIGADVGQVALATGDVVVFTGTRQGGERSRVAKVLFVPVAGATPVVTPTATPTATPTMAPANGNLWTDVRSAFSQAGCANCHGHGGTYASSNRDTSVNAFRANRQIACNVVRTGFMTDGVTSTNLSAENKVKLLTWLRTSADFNGAAAVSNCE